MLIPPVTVALYDDAEVPCRKSLSTQPNPVVAMARSGDELTLQKKFNVALDVLNRAAQLDPKNAHIRQIRLHLHERFAPEGGESRIY